jgi:L-lysine 2,3-aminomutase
MQTKSKKIEIYCEALNLPPREFNKIPLSELREMVGWIEPDKGMWNVVLMDGGGFACKNQETAQIIASLEEIKALFELTTDRPLSKAG